MALLSTEKAKRAMVSFAQLFDENLTEFPRIFQGATDAQVRTRIDTFVEILRHRAPLVVIDGELTDPRIPSFHPRGVWAGDFDIQSQAIFLNRKVCFRSSWGAPFIYFDLAY